MTGKTIGWGLIGASTIAREWMVDAIRSNADSRIEAVCSGDVSRAKALAAEKGISEAYGSLVDLLENPKIDAVYISSTNERHLYEALAAAKAGIHVLCEKPLALEPNEAEEMVETCKRAGVVLATNHHLRDMESHRAIKRLIDEGAIGKVTSIRVFHAGQLSEELKTWRDFKESTGAGAIFDLMIHDADLLRYYLGRNPIRVTATATTSGDGPKDIEDSVQSTWQFSDNVSVQCQESFIVGTAPRGIEVNGSKGSILGAEIMSHQRPGGAVTLRTAAGEENIPLENKITYHRGVADFVGAVQGVGRPSATGEDGVWSLKLAKAVALSAASGEAVTIT
jgi:1,5-anhydro-D-fructose reductase (1,5-anhydro-D-mannitol-forming)